MTGQFRVEQEKDYPLFKAVHHRFQIRGMYRRSRETGEADFPGQDYMTYKVSADTCIFGVCDGVGQSYFGQVAAKYLGDALLDHLDNLDGERANPELFREGLHTYLCEITMDPADLTKLQPIPAGVPALLRDVLEEKKALGSQTTFACGRVDRLSEERSRIILAWMGDTKIRLWKEADEVIGWTGYHADPFSPKRRWSMTRGTIGGMPNVAVLENDHRNPFINRMQIYTDGLKNYDGSNCLPEDGNLAQLAEQALSGAESDDLSFLEIVLL